MKTLNWRRTGLFTKNFIFTLEQQIIGQLTFDSSWNFNALYTDTETKLKFTQKGFWDRNVLIFQNGNTIGEIHIGLFGQALTLMTGERFILSISFWEQEVYWKTEKGETIMKYQQATISSMEKGQISSKDSLMVEREKILISSGIFVRQLTRKRRAITVALMIPIIAAVSQH